MDAEPILNRGSRQADPVLARKGMIPALSGSPTLQGKPVSSARLFSQTAARRRAPAGLFCRALLSFAPVLGELELRLRQRRELADSEGEPSYCADAVESLL